MNIIAGRLVGAARTLGLWATIVTNEVPGSNRGEARGSEHERGDVPGWVMITLMSAVLVMGLLAIAAPALEGLFQQAISKVSK
ncbi:hypothetical protein [Sinomonas sp.]|uniref:hypothetical protein n=1 Tax=Sinomonas sp. TaxID=1914986 RepID=UPI002FDFCCDA